jgi:hypothetical protein
MNILTKPFVSDTFRYQSNLSGEALVQELTVFSNKPFWNVDESDVLGSIEDDGSFSFVYRRKELRNRKYNTNANLTLMVYEAPHGSEVELVASPSLVSLIILFVSAALGVVILYSRLSGSNHNDNLIWMGLFALIVIPALIMIDSVMSKANIVTDVVKEFNFHPLA